MASNETQDNSTSTGLLNTGNIEFNAAFWITLVLTVTCALSTAFLAIHLYKFLRSPSPQSLSSKNLTLYCFILLLHNIYTELDWYDFLHYLYSSLDEVIPMFIHIYTRLTITFFKFIIALEICLCFRQVAVYFQKPSGPQNKKFVICVISGLGIPLLPTFIAFYFSGYFHADPKPLTDYSNDSGFFQFMAFLRIARLIPVLGAFWYLRSASIDKHELLTNFSLHVRLLMMIGGTAALLGVVEVIIVKFVMPQGNEVGKTEIGLLFAVAYDVGAMLEGLLIGILFTFKQSTFKSVKAIKS